MTGLGTLQIDLDKIWQYFGACYLDENLLVQFIKIQFDRVDVNSIRAGKHFTQLEKKYENDFSEKMLDKVM